MGSYRAKYHSLTILATLILMLAGVANLHAQCIDWSTIPTVPVAVDWNGPDFLNRTGGWIKDGYMMKRFDDTYEGGEEAFFEFYDIRDLANPTLIYDAHLWGSHGIGGFSIAAAQDSLCLIYAGGPGYNEYFFVRAEDPQTTHDAPLSGYVALEGHKMFQMANNWLDGTDGVGLYDITDVTSIVELGFHTEVLYNLGPYPLSGAAVLVLDDGGMMEVVDFTNPVAPIVRSEVSVTHNYPRWLGRIGDLVFFSDRDLFYALDVSDLDDIQVAYTLPNQVLSMAIQGNLAALNYDNSVTDRLQIFDLSDPAGPVAMGPAFGGYVEGTLAWDGEVLYTDEFVGFDVSDPSTPLLLGGTSLFINTGSYVQDRYLVTAYGLYPAHCGPVANVGPATAVDPRLLASPNPFNPITTLRFEIGTAGPATLNVYDLKGRMVRQLVDGDLPVGDRVVSWDGRDAEGHSLPGGIYLARLRSKGGDVIRKLMLIK